MAENIIISLAEPVVLHAIERLSELLFNEAASLRNVKTDVERLRAELDRMHCFLEDADRRQEQDKRVRHWIAQVRDVADDVEDVIEIFISKVSSSRVKCFHLHKLRKQINSIKAKMEDIFRSAQMYRIESAGSTGEGTSTNNSTVAELQRRLRRSCPEDDEDGDGDGDVISMEESANSLKIELMKTEDHELSIVSVVGMGGLGKTTLAKKVYKSSDVKQNFDCCAWVFISQQYVPKDILYEILVQIDGDSEREKLRNLNENELSDRLKGELKGKSYLVVLDDIWRIEAWDSIKRAFPIGKKSSKVVFTTRNKEVMFRVADPSSSPIEPSFLTFEESWELLQRKAFRRNTLGGHGFRPEFEKLGKEMVKKCGGLPLAIVVLGGLLRTRTSVDEWKDVQKDLNSHLNKLQSRQEYEGVNGILALSYYDLPYYLKPCFLYLGCFPEDMEIPKKTLIQLWIAEGFVQKPGREEANETVLENVCEQYLGELTDRCMIQVSKRNNSGVGVKTYRIHDLMRDLCVSKARDENFFQIIQHDIEMNMSEAGPSVHHSATKVCSRKIVIDVHCDFERCKVQFHLRSLLCFNANRFLVSSLRRKNFMLLRTLELGGNNLRHRFEILKGICTLVHLRYLGLQKADLPKLPNSIRNLRSLHTLDIRYNSVNVLPRGFSRLTRLTHLLSDKPLMLMDKDSGEFFLSYGIIRFRPDNPILVRDNPVMENAKHTCVWSWCANWAVHLAGPMMGPTHELHQMEGSDCTPAPDAGGLSILRPIIVRAVLMFRYEALVQLTNLQELKMLLRSKTEATMVLESPITKCGRLRSLDLDMVFCGHVDENQQVVMSFPSLKSLSRCRLLHKLRLRGKIEQDSPHHCLQSLPASLTKLTLEHAHIQNDPMAVLEQLPNLRLLQLHSLSYIGSKMVCSTGGFPKLETLRLCYLKKLEEWEIEKDAMSSLKRLDLEHILKLKMIPDGLKFVSTLRRLDVREMTKSFEDRLRVSEEGIEGEDFYKVRHIPTILIN